MSYNILNPVALKQVGTICISKKDTDYRPIYELDEIDVQLGANYRIGSTKNYSQPQFIKDKDGNCIHNPLFHTFLCQIVPGSKCTLLLMSDDAEEWDKNNKLYFYEIYYEKKTHF